MKRLSLYLFLILFTLQTSALVQDEVEIDTLFGVKIFDDIEKFANKDSGMPQDNRPGTFFFSDEVINIERDSKFDSFYIRTDNKYKVINITGKKFFTEKHSSFNNNCLKDKIKMVEEMSLFFDSSKEKFVQYYWHNQEFKSIWDESQLIYNDESNKLVISIHCNYRKAKENILAELGISWVTYDYFEKHVKGLWKEIKQFDDEFIKSFLIVAENI